MAKNNNLSKAKREKNDEFYTQMVDIERELQHYLPQLKGKVVYCNCDIKESNFIKYFEKNTDIKELLQSSCDFRSEDSIELLKKADIVVTNPPFSLFREYIAQLVEHNKKFLVIGNNNAITYKEVFRFIKEDKMWLGYNNNKTMEFQLADSYTKWNRIDDNGKKYGSVPAITWFTNLQVTKRKEELILFREYNEIDYPKYDNYDAIEVNKVANIPKDYFKTMGVPITFLDKHNPDQFEICGTQRWFYDESLGITNNKTLINGKETYDRIFIKRKDIKEK